MEELINPQNTARMLGVCVATLRNWEKNGKIISVRTVGGHRRYRIDDIKLLIQKKE